MARLQTCIIATLFSYSALTEQHDQEDVEVLEAVKAFNGDYDCNNVDA